MEKLIIIRTKSELVSLVKHLEEADFVAFDTETTGVSHSAEVIGVSVSSTIDEGYYVILKSWNKETKTLDRLETLDTITELFEVLCTKRLVMHNGIFDCRMVLNNFKVDLIPSLHTDTMELAHLLDENRSVGLKELASQLFGNESTLEQLEMKKSVIANGGTLTKKAYELYKADADLLAKYGAKDTILTLKLFYQFVPDLFSKGLENFFYEDESMPLLRGASYHLNTTGLRVDIIMLKELKEDLKKTCQTLQAEILRDIEPYIKETYPGTNKKTTFNLGSNQQMAWLLFIKLGNTFLKLTKKGRTIAKDLIGKVPYAPGAKLQFLQACTAQSLKAEKFIQADSKALMNLAKKYRWVEKLLEFNRLETLLKNFVLAIESRTQYGIIHPSFLQHGTSSGRYASRDPNFQNLPRDDKRIKKCIVSRPGQVFVGADYSQLEPRIFASFSQDPELMKCFETGEDMYSVIGIKVFNRFECSSNKKDAHWFGKLYENERNIAKKITLSSTYGTTAWKLADELRDSEGRNLKPDECQAIIDGYFNHFPKVLEFMLQSHEIVKKEGVVHSLFGRPRRIPGAKQINLYRNVSHSELPYDLRTFLNLSVNHRIQSTGASIVNRAAIKFLQLCEEHKLQSRIVLQVHDEIVAECAEGAEHQVASLLKESMETCAVLPGVKLVAEPKIAKNLADLK